MSHVDEGRLNEYLDRLERPADGRAGAWPDRAEIESHLAECGPCRVLLAEARHLRARASSLLDAAAPASTSLPPFADVLARAGHTERRRRIVRMNRLTALGWAATVVLAVGVGWIARGTVGVDGTALSRQPAGQVANEGVPSTSDEAPAASVAADIADVAQRTDIVAEREEASQVIPARRQQVPAASPPAALEPGERDIPDAAVEELAPPDAAAKGVGAVERAAKAEGVHPDSTTREREAREAFAAGVVAVDAVPAPDAVAAPTEVEIAVPETEWAAADLATAATYLAGPIRSVPNLPIASVETGSLFGRPAVRLHQRSGAATVEVIQAAGAVLENLVVDSGAARLRQGRGVSATTSAIVVVRNGTVVILRAALPPDSLRLLASRIP